MPLSRTQSIYQILEALSNAWQAHPDMELGALITNAPYFEADGTNTGYAPPPAVVSDAQMLVGLNGITRAK